MIPHNIPMLFAVGVFSGTLLKMIQARIFPKLRKPNYRTISKSQEYPMIPKESSYRGRKWLWNMGLCPLLKEFEVGLPRGVGCPRELGADAFPKIFRWRKSVQNPHGGFDITQCLESSLDFRKEC
jgi:hypothetical protein